MLSILLNVLVFSIISTSSYCDAQRSSSSGGIIGNHGQLTNGGFTGTSGSITHGGFVGHQNINDNGSGGFVGHSNLNKPTNGGFVGHRQSPSPSTSRVIRAATHFGRSQQYQSPAAVAQSYHQRPQPQPQRPSWQNTNTNYNQPKPFKPQTSNYNQFGRQQAASAPLAAHNQENPDQYDSDVLKPYSFQYEADDPDGKKTWRQEQRDDNGIITGSYTIQAPYGAVRVVNYRADSEGFHAEISSNEPGMIDSEPSNVIIRKSGEWVYSPEELAAASARAASSDSSSRYSTYQQ